MESGKKKVIYDGTMHCFKKIWLDEGIRGFFKGAAVNVIRGTGGALILVFYDEVKQIMNFYQAIMYLG